MRTSELLVLICLPAVVLPACSDVDGHPAEETETAADTTSTAAEPEAAPEKDTPAADEEAFLSRPARKHPFLPVVGIADADRNERSEENIQLKAVFCGAEASAIVQFGDRSRLVREGDELYGVTVRHISTGRIVISRHGQEQTLDLYDR